MTREEYLKELDANLITLPKEERDMAVSFYSEYFDDAGPEKEQATIEELGKPYNLAMSIIGETSLYSKSKVYQDYKMSKPMPQNTTGVFVSLQKPNAFQNRNTADKDAMPKAAQNNQSGSPFEQPEPQEVYPNGDNNNAKGSGMFDDYYRNGGNADREEAPPPPPPPEKKGLSGGLIALLIVIGVITGIIPAFIGFIVAMFAVGVASVLCLSAAVIILIVAITKFVVSAPLAVGLILSSLLAAGIGLMMLSIAILFFFKFMPWLVKSIGRLFGKRRAA